MAETQSRTRLVRFGAFEADVLTGELREDGVKLKLSGQPFQVLAILLERPGDLVTRDELQKYLWPNTFVDVERNLNTAINKIRDALGDSAETPRYVETIPRRGYRFIGTLIVPEPMVVRPEDPPSPNLVPSNPAAPTDGARKDEFRKRLRTWLLRAAAVLAPSLACVVWYLLHPLPPPRVTGYTRITHDRLHKFLTGTDGTRLYVNLYQTGKVAQVTIPSGDMTEISLALPGSLICCVSPDGETLLLGSSDGTLWTASTQGGSLRRLSDKSTDSATWSPDGKSVAYTADNGDIYVMRRDGTDVHKLASAGGFVLDMAWSPDGKTIRYTKDNQLWEISSTGSTPRRLLTGWPASVGLCDGRWTRDGEFFIFLAGDQHLTESATTGTGQLWALDERRGLLRRPPTEPVKLTSDPLGWGVEIPGREARTIFASAKTPLGELLWFDTKTKLIQPYLAGISAEFLSFSPDGKSIAYVTYPEGILWRANRDGGGRVQMSDPPLIPMFPRWSPDGSKIVFVASSGSPNHSTIFTVSSEGGKPARLLPEESGDQVDPTWSHDGQRIVYADGLHGDLRILDITSRQVAAIPGSHGMISPRWSPNGRAIAAVSADGLALKIFHIAKQQWSSLLHLQTGGIDFNEWSRDSRFIYFLRVADNPGVYRVRVPGNHTDRVFDLTGFHHAGFNGFWFGLDPTDAPLLLRDAGLDDIYALTLEAK